MLFSSGHPSLSVIPHKGLRSRPEHTVSAHGLRISTARNVRVAGSRAREGQVAAMTQFACVPDGRLAYDVAGAGDPPMIFVHGWCCDRSYFAPQVTHFSGSHAVATVDLRGHGESSAPDPSPGAYDIAVLADDVLAVATAAALQRPVLVGHSLGALIGLVCAARPRTRRTRGSRVRAAAQTEPDQRGTPGSATHVRRSWPRRPAGQQRPARRSAPCSTLAVDGRPGQP